MVKVFQGTDKEFYMDGYLKENLDTAKSVVKKDWDMLFIVDGEEGCGKSVLAMQMAYYLDPTLTLDRIVFTPREFRLAVKNGKSGQAIVYDEAYTGLSSRAAMTLINRTLVKLVAECRQKNLFVFVVMPAFFDLDKYVTLWRGRALIHVYSKAFERGFFEFYNKDRKKSLYVTGKKFYSYYHVKPNFRGCFTKHYTLNEAKYRARKRGSLIAREDETEKKLLMKVVQKELFQRMVTDQVINDRVPNFVKAKILGITEPTFYLWIKEFNELKEFT